MQHQYTGVFYLFAVMLSCTLTAGCADLDYLVEDEQGTKTGDNEPLDAFELVDPVDLRLSLWSHGVKPLMIDNVKPMDDPEVKLGQLLFFDPILSGNQDIACSTCNRPNFATSDALPTSIGVGGSGLGPTISLGQDRELIPRNSPALFNRGSPHWETMFWDARISVAAGYFDTPAGSGLPHGLSTILAAQAMFPVTSADEMRGHGDENALSGFTSDELEHVWAGLTARVISIDEYAALFAEAYPGVSIEETGFEHIANALATFEVAAFTKTDSPFDRFLGGDVHDLMVSFLGPEILACQYSQDEAVRALVAFLKALTDQSARDMSHLVPVAVPSGLPVF